MTTDVVTVAADTPYKGVLQRLLEADVSGVPVVDDDRRLLGIITEADLVAKEAYPGHRRRALALLADIASARDHHWVAKSTGSTAAEIMTTRVATCAPDEDVHSVARRMLRDEVKRVPVVEEGRVVGIVSRQDLLAVFDRPDEAVAAEIHRLLGDSLRMPEKTHVQAGVHDGVVTLTGDVHYRWDVGIVVSLVTNVRGVIEVANELRWREENPKPLPQGLA